MLAECEVSGQKADQVIHLAAVKKFPDEDLTKLISLLDKLCHHTIHQGVVIALQIILNLATLKPLKTNFSFLTSKKKRPYSPVCSTYESPGVDEDGHEAVSLGGARGRARGGRHSSQPR